ncbi:Hypothetical predicted protein, partial [Marmota monax]
VSTTGNPDWRRLSIARLYAAEPGPLSARAPVPQPPTLKCICALVLLALLRGSQHWSFLLSHL